MRPLRKLGNNIGAGRLNRAGHIPRASGSRVCWTMPSLFRKMTLNTGPLDDTSRIGAGTLDEEHPVREEAVPQAPAGAGEEATLAAPVGAGKEVTPAAPGSAWRHRA